MMRQFTVQIEPLNDDPEECKLTFRVIRHGEVLVDFTDNLIPGMARINDTMLRVLEEEPL